MLAADCGDLSAVQTMIKDGADVDQRNPIGVSGGREAVDGRTKLVGGGTTWASEEGGAEGVCGPPWHRVWGVVGAGHMNTPHCTAAHPSESIRCFLG